MDEPLLLSTLLWRTERLYHDKTIVTRLGHDRYHSYTYAECGQRVRRLANALTTLGVEQGDRVATLAWNHYRHFETYYAVPGMGATLHTVNLRLFEEQQAYTLNHAGSKVLILDVDQLSLAEKLVEIGIPGIESFVIMTDGPLPETTLSPVYHYEELLAAASPAFEFPELDERSAAAICFTSATTGNPKGVVYSHRALVLQSMALNMQNQLGIREQEIWMAISPMFHANAWCVPHAALLAGATLVLPGVHPLEADYIETIRDQRVTGMNAAVTVGSMMRDYLLDGHDDVDTSSLQRMWLGGQAPPRGLMEWWGKNRGVTVFTGYGMTESSPQVCFYSAKSSLSDLDEESVWRRRTSGGLPIPLMRVKIVDEAGEELPWDGNVVGTIMIRSPYTVNGYLDDPRSATAVIDGWFDTGDLGCIDPDGYVTVKDRAKDLIKSGGEWISSIDLENALMTHPHVREATVVSVPHEKWLERPVACVVLNHSTTVTGAELSDFLQERFAKWWIPDAFLFLADVPKTSMGKFNKKLIRELIAEGGLQPVEEWTNTSAKESSAAPIAS
ncbi:long-chain fatty acid--CoA ligase [Cryobacterium flavum]|nr:long-chain fatty acid--CoA ligase [Cryobacterium flavum]